MPLLFDMPLEQLETYQGINPCPGDFDEFWNSGLDEMRSLEPGIELRNASFGAPYAECFSLFFSGTGNARLHAKFVKPKEPSEYPHPAVIMFHGYSGSSGDWSGMLAYAAAGFSVAALDCRGQGGRSVDTGGVAGNTLHGHIIRGLDGPPENMLYRHIFLDTAMTVRILMDMDDIDEKRIGVTGASQGGGLSLACAALMPDINRSAPVYPFLSDYRRIWNIDLARNAYSELQEYFKRFDPLHEREDEVFLKLGYVDVQHLASRVKGEVMMAAGLMDQICPPSTQFAAYNKITSRKSRILYPDFGHEALPGHPDRIFEFMMEMRER